jgi:aromatic-L-amino-acid/L-tryptophan decarboxylase
MRANAANAHLKWWTGGRRCPGGGGALECGSVLIRDGALLERTFSIHPDYLDRKARHDANGEVNCADRGLQLSRSFRALKIWVAVQTFGVAAGNRLLPQGMAWL